MQGKLSVPVAEVPAKSGIGIGGVWRLLHNGAIALKKCVCLVRGQDILKKSGVDLDACTHCDLAVRAQLNTVGPYQLSEVQCV